MYKIGEFYVDILSKYNHVIARAEKYKSTYTGEADFCVIPDRCAPIDPTVYPDKNIMEYCLLGDNFAEKVLDFQSVVIHASAISVDNNAYIFFLFLGTGKSTHTKLWKTVLCNKLVNYINDDKPLLRIRRGKIMAYGTPFSGKTDKNDNICVPVKAICFLKQDQKNWICPLSERDAKKNFIEQTLKGLNKDMQIKLEQTVSEIVERVPMYEMGCRPDREAAIMSYKILSGIQKLKKGNIYIG